MISWLIPKQFCMGLVCAGILQGFNTSNVLYARVQYVALSIFAALTCLFIRIFSESMQKYLSFVTSSCKTGDCISTTITHGAMISLALFHLSVLVLTVINREFSSAVYQQCWVMKFILYFAFLFLSILATSFLEYYFYVAVTFSFIYLAIQCVYSIELAYDWNDSWFNHYTESEAPLWAGLLFGGSGLCWILILYFVFLSYSTDFFAYFLAFLIVSIVVTVLSCSSYCENGSLLSASLTFLLAFYYLGDGFIFDSEGINMKSLLIDVFLSFIILVYIAIVYNETNQGPIEARNTELKDFNKFEEGKSDQLESNHEGMVNYRNFQLVLMCYSLFLGMVLTGWEKEKVDYAPSVVRISQACILAAFYIWTLAAPFIFPERNFIR